MDEDEDEHALVGKYANDPRGKNKLASPGKTVTDKALYDAERESIQYLRDLAFSVPYGPYAKKGMSFQNFQRTRRIAFQDEFEELSDEQQQRDLPSHADLFQIRTQPEYLEMRRQFRQAIDDVEMPATSKEFMNRIGKVAWKKIERDMRSDNEFLARDSLAVAAEILQIEQPKASRTAPPTVQISLDEGMLRTIAAAFREAGEEPPALPTRIKGDVVEIETES